MWTIFYPHICFNRPIQADIFVRTVPEGYRLEAAASLGSFDDEAEESSFATHPPVAVGPWDAEECVSGPVGTWAECRRYK